MKASLRLALVALTWLTGVGVAAAADPPTWKWYQVKGRTVHLHLHVFESSTCPHCIQAEAFLTKLEARYDWLTVFRYEVTGNPANLALYQAMATDVGRQAGIVPAFFHCKQLTLGYGGEETTGKQLEQQLVRCRDALQKQLDQRPPPDVAPMRFFTPPEAPLEPDIELDLPPPPAEEGEPSVDLPWWGAVKADEVSLPVLTAVLGGLDSFNPCAFFVLLILLGLMTHTNSRGKMLLVGGVFVTVSGLVYFLFMTSWLNLFFLIGHLKVITLVAGVVAVAAAVINVKDYFWFKQGVSLSLTDTARSRLIGRMTDLLRRGGVLPVMAGTAALAFVANLYEVLCTSGFPLVYTRVLTLRELSPGAYYGYLVLYNLVYVAPLFLIVVGFSLTLSSRRLTEYQGRVLKLVSGLMMLVLGVTLLIDPAFLNNLVGAGVTLAAAVGGAAIVVLVHRAVVRRGAAGVSADNSGQQAPPPAAEPRSG